MSTQNELFRFAATVGRDYSESDAGAAISTVLEWASDGLEKPLPQQAWDSKPFKHFTRNSNCAATRILDDGRDIWAVRVDRSEGTNAKGIRSTEAVVQKFPGKRTSLTVRQLADRFSRIEAAPPQTPPFVRDLNAKVGLYSQWARLESDPWVVTAEDEFHRMVSMLVDSTREWPMLVLSVPEYAPTPLSPLLDPESLARATYGLATVVVLPHEYTWELTKRFGKDLSVYLGAARVYRPGFDERSDPWAHELELVQRVDTPDGRARITAKLQRTAAQLSLERFALGSDILEFAAIRRESNQLQRPAPVERKVEVQPETQPTAEVAPAPPEPAVVPPQPVSPPESEAPPAAPPPEVADPTPPPAPSAPVQVQAEPAAVEPPAPPVPEPARRPAGLGARIAEFLGGIFPGGRKLREAEAALQASRSEVERLEAKVKEAEEFSSLVSDEHQQAEKRAKEAEEQLAEARLQIEELEGRLEELGADGELPVSWSEFAAWCERRLEGKVMLSQQAKREVKKAKYKDVAAAAKGLLWLGGEYRDQRLMGGDGTVRGQNSVGLFNEPCGGSTFKVQWSGRWADVKWHVKNGGNTTDPTRCLRIYYFWDDTNDQVVVASMPGHYRITGR